MFRQIFQKMKLLKVKRDHTNLKNIGVKTMAIDIKTACAVGHLAKSFDILNQEISISREKVKKGLIDGRDGLEEVVGFFLDLFSSLESLLVMAKKFTNRANVISDFQKFVDTELMKEVQQEILIPFKKYLTVFGLILQYQMKKHNIIAELELEEKHDES